MKRGNTREVETMRQSRCRSILAVFGIFRQASTRPSARGSSRDDGESLNGRPPLWECVVGWSVEQRCVALAIKHGWWAGGGGGCGRAASARDVRDEDGHRVKLAAYQNLGVLGAAHE
jgi:hypothetical protein